MKKRHVLFILLMGCIAWMQQSCIDKEYNLDDDNLDKNAYLSPDGISIPLPGVDSIGLTKKLGLEGNVGVGVTATHTIEDLFSDDTNEKFFSTNYPSDFVMTALIDVEIQFAAPAFRALVTPTIIGVDEEGNKYDLGISSLTVQEVTNKTANDFIINIPKEEMVKMKNARDLKLTFEFRNIIAPVTPRDIILIKQIVLTKTGGINWEL